MKDAHLDLSTDVFVPVSEVWAKDYADPSHGFGPSFSEGKAKQFHNGAYLAETLPCGEADDNHFEFYGDNWLRYVDKSQGMAISFPLLNGQFPADYTLVKYGLKVPYPNRTFRLSEEDNYYSPDEKGYSIYVGEWMSRYFVNPMYLTQNGLRYFADPIVKDTALIPGYEISVYAIEITNPGPILSPFYHIAWIRKKDTYSHFALLLLKGQEKDEDLFKEVLLSYREIARLGQARNYPGRYPVVMEKNWDATTTALYRHYLEKKSFDFGVFSASLCNDDDPRFAAIEKRVALERARLESNEGLGYSYRIMPTYSHLIFEGNEHHFPLRLANEFAGGDGKNGRPILQFAYQFTTNNNKVYPANISECYTPMFDILRGKYDALFATIASGMKAYGKPLIFRLNNEMNSDWTSYCGMMTLIDPDIFISTWRYLYDFFIRHGVSNAIWEFNPVTVSCPASHWGEDLAYYPGSAYVHLLGLTQYEMNNKDGKVTSFRDLYTKTYEKEGPQFAAFPWIVGEFACGSGGETSGKLFRNEKSQAAWVEAMFDDFAHRSIHPYLDPIIGAVWFSANDESDGKISNSLVLSAHLPLTLKAFREGFAKLASPR
jgi:hypothetical protein